jgi:hypothetical protein
VPPIEQLRQARHDLDPRGGVFALCQNRPPFLGWQGRDRQHDRIDAVLAYQAADVVTGAKDAQALNPLPVLIGIVIDEADGQKTQFRVELKLAGEPLTSSSGPDDEHAMRCRFA